MSDLATFHSHLELYSQGPAQLRQSLQTVPAAALDWHPDQPADAWSIKEHIIHIVDSDISGFFRWRQALAQDTPPAPFQNEDLWARNIDHANESLEDFLQLMEILHKITFKSLKTLDLETVLNRTFNHPKGPMTIARWAEIYSRHVGFHLDYIQRNLELFQAKGL